MRIKVRRRNLIQHDAAALGVALKQHLKGVLSAANILAAQERVLWEILKQTMSQTKPSVGTHANQIETVGQTGGRQTTTTIYLLEIVVTKDSISTFTNQCKQVNCLAAIIYFSTLT